MREILIDKNNVSELDALSSSLTRIYKYGFALPPWNERSRCPLPECKVDFSECEAGSVCMECEGVLIDAYDETQLAQSWRQLVAEEDAMMEVALDQEDRVRRATIARPTNPSELFERKYGGNEAMKMWLAANLTPEFVWIEDTFADIANGEKGNLQTRDRTLGRIAFQYGGLPIATRTKSPAIVRATLRDFPENTTVYVGSDAAGSALENVIDLSRYERVPDERTLLSVDIRGVSV